MSKFIIELNGSQLEIIYQVVKEEKEYLQKHEPSVDVSDHERILEQIDSIRNKVSN